MIRPPVHHAGGTFTAPARATTAERLEAPAAAAVAKALDLATRTLEAEQRQGGGEGPDPGVILARVVRDDGTELRVSVHRYEGRPFVRVAPWQRRGEGAPWWPVKGRGVTVKVREVAHVVVGLARALEHLGGRGANDAGPPAP